jgi:hypothetical protein
VPRFSPRLILAKTADYSVLADDGGTLFTTRGASGAVNFTLPATATLTAGWNCDFFSAAAQNMTVTAATADTITTFNDLTADSVAFSTSSELIGASVRMTWDGTGWLCQVMAEETQTMTVAT